MVKRTNEPQTRLPYLEQIRAEMGAIDPEDYVPPSGARDPGVQPLGVLTNHQRQLLIYKQQLADRVANLKELHQEKYMAIRAAATSGNGMREVLQNIFNGAVTQDDVIELGVRESALKDAGTLAILVEGAWISEVSTDFGVDDPDSVRVHDDWTISLETEPDAERCTICGGPAHTSVRVVDLSELIGRM